MLSGKIAVVTGAGGGIGRECCRILARNNADVIVVGRHEQNIRETSDMIKDEGFKSNPFLCDVSDRKNIDLFSDYIKKEYGRIDILVNNAGLFLPTDILAGQISDEWQKMIDVNIKGVISMTHASVPFMKEGQKSPTKKEGL